MGVRPWALVGHRHPLASLPCLLAGLQVRWCGMAGPYSPGRRLQAAHEMLALSPKCGICGHPPSPPRVGFLCASGVKLELHLVCLGYVCSATLPFCASTRVTSI